MAAFSTSELVLHSHDDDDKSPSASAAVATPSSKKKKAAPKKAVAKKTRAPEADAEPETIDLKEKGPEETTTYVQDFPDDDVVFVPHEVRDVEEEEDDTPYTPYTPVDSAVPLKNGTVLGLSLASILCAGAAAFVHYLL